MIGVTLDKAKDAIFNTVHRNNLIYNACWEDPRIDRELLNFGPGSKVVMITSAGCNALSYLLDSPESIDCVDMNPRQNALLELKKAFYRELDHETLFACLGKGAIADFKSLYNSSLRTSFNGSSREFWDKRWRVFDEKSKRKSFYFYGTSGTFAWLINKYLKRRKKYFNEIIELLDAPTLEKQLEIYNRVEHYIMHPLLRWFMKRQAVLSLLGVPRNQKEILESDFDHGLTGFIQTSLRRVFTELPIGENYFWRVYLTGQYTRECCPDYLLPENFDFYKKHEDRVRVHTNTITGFLRENPANYSHYILLDHQDWLAFHQPQELENEWREVLKNSVPGTQILFRSAGTNADFLPDFVKEVVKMRPDKTDKHHFYDRVGTYGSTHLAEVL